MEEDRRKRREEGMKGQGAVREEKAMRKEGAMVGKDREVGRGEEAVPQSRIEREEIREKRFAWRDGRRRTALASRQRPASECGSCRRC
jgi:hypothetical protein